MKLIASNPALGAFVILLGCTFLVDTAVAVASSPRILRGQLHKSNNKPSRRRVKAEVAPLKETTLKDAPVKAPLDANREAPIPKEEKVAPPPVKTKTKEAPDSSMLKPPPVPPLDKQLPKGPAESSMNLGHLLVTSAPTPTMAPIEDEELEGDGVTEEIEEDTDFEMVDIYGDEDLEVQEVFLETNSLNEISSSTVISGCITVNVIAFLFWYQNAW